MTTEGGECIAHEFEVAGAGYQPDALIISAGNLTRNGCNIVSDDDGSFVEDKRSGRRMELHMCNNTYEFRALVHDHAGSHGVDVEEAVVLPLGTPSASTTLTDLASSSQVARLGPDYPRVLDSVGGDAASAQAAALSTVEARAICATHSASANRRRSGGA